MNHAKYSPSKFPAWYQCGNFDSEKNESEEMQRGTKLHAAIHEKILDKNDIYSTLSFLDKCIVDDFLKWIYSFDFETISTECFLRHNNDFFGTADTIIEKTDGSIIIDFKTGQIRNYFAQLAGYKILNGIENCELYCYFGDADDEYFFEKFDIPLSECREIVSICMRNFDEKIISPEKIDYCSWCSNKSSCPTFCNQLPEILEKKELTIKSLSDSDLNKAFSNISGIEKLIEELKDEIRFRMENGSVFENIIFQDRRAPRHVFLEKIIDYFGKSIEELAPLCSISLTNAINFFSERESLKKKDAEKKLEEIGAIRDSELIIKTLKFKGTKNESNF
jgi:hypothetical protein